MTCLNPTRAWICGYTRCKADGVISPRLVFSEKEAMRYYNRISSSRLECCKYLETNCIDVPCGKCAACQIVKRKAMSVRLSHEARMHDDCCFLTLTYDDENVPTTDWNVFKSPIKQFDRGLGSLPELTLLPADVQKFMKRLRRHLEYHYGYRKLRYFAVGEYGTRTHRPHYHILIFGWSPDDKVLLKTHNGKPVYRSPMLERLWKFGFSSVSDVNTAVAKYAARYVTKKFSRLEDGDSEYLVPEFILQSKRDGAIGATWFDRYGADACKVGLCTVDCGSHISKCVIPKYYWSRLRAKNLPLWLQLREERIKFLKGHVGLGRLYDDVRRMVDCVRYADYVRSQKEVF